MGVRPLLLEATIGRQYSGSKSRRLSFQIPRSALRCTRRGGDSAPKAGYKVDSVTVPDSVYAIEDPARPGLLKIDVEPPQMANRLPKASRGARGWTAGKADYAIKPSVSRLVRANSLERSYTRNSRNRDASFMVSVPGLTKKRSIVSLSKLSAF
jgi:hypothetical protein